MDCANPDCLGRAEFSFEMRHKETNEVKRMYWCGDCARKVLGDVEVVDELPVNRAARRRNEARSRKRQAKAHLN